MKEDFYKKLMKQSKLELPFPDFEEEVITQIKVNELQQKKVTTYTQKAWLFFIVGLLCGAFLTVLISDLQFSVISFETYHLKIISQMVVSVFILLNLDFLLRNTSALSYLQGF